MGEQVIGIAFSGIERSKKVKITSAKVDSIEVLNLDEGSTNGGSNTKKGIIHGKE